MRIETVGSAPAVIVMITLVDATCASGLETSTLKTNVPMCKERLVIGHAQLAVGAVSPHGAPPPCASKAAALAVSPAKMLMALLLCTAHAQSKLIPP